VFKPYAFIRNTCLSLLCVTFFAASMSGGASPAAAADCQTALGSSTSAVALSNGTFTTKSQGVDEWDGDVLKIRTSLPGVVVIEASGAGAQNSLYTQGSSSSHPLIDRARLGTNLRELRAIVRAGDHCVQVTPPPGATGTYAVTASFTDVCHLGDVDDHGDSFLCATSVNVEDTASGEISPASTASDYDMFTFELTSAATVAVESTGSTDVAGELYDADGVLLESDDNGGTSPNFMIIRSLEAGRYYVQIEGVEDDGAFGLSVSLVP
jgi:Bacterial pre-peptidase C-terminal domain